MHKNVKKLENCSRVVNIRHGEQQIVLDMLKEDGAIVFPTAYVEILSYVAFKDRPQFLNHKVALIIAFYFQQIQPDRELEVRWINQDDIIFS